MIDELEKSSLMTPIGLSHIRRDFHTLEMRAYVKFREMCSEEF
jgi:hypothetical protein